MGITGSGVVTFLSKLGKALAEGIAILTGLGPVIAPLLGSAAPAAGSVENTVINDLTSVGQVVVQAEAMLQTPGSGAQKLAAAAPLVAQIIKMSQLVSGKKVANQTLFIQGCTDLTSAVAEILNSLEPQVGTEGKAITAIPVANVAPVATPAPAPEPEPAPVAAAVPLPEPVAAPVAVASSPVQQLAASKS